MRPTATRLAAAMVGAAATVTLLVVPASYGPAAAAAPAAGQVHVTRLSSHHVNHYAAARRQWRAGAQASAALQSRYWLHAARDLVAAPGQRYFPRIRQLITLTTYPDTGLTRRQIREVRALTRALNRFFHTPGLYL